MILLLSLSGALAAPLSLTYEQALEVAASKNPGLRGAQADVNRADGAVLAARAPFEPTVNASTSFFSSTSEGTAEFGNFFADTSGWRAQAGIAQTFSTGTSLGVDLSSSQNVFFYRLPDTGLEFTGDPQYQSSLVFTLSQSLLQGHRLAWNLQGVRSAKGARSAAEASRQSARQDALANTATAYWNVRTQKALVAIAEQTLAISEEQHRVVLALVEGGRLAPVEATRSEAAKVQAERAVIDAQSAHAAAQDALLLLIGEAPGQDVVVLSNPEEPTALALDADAVVERVLQGNPQLLAAKVVLDTRRAALAAARHGLLPSLGANASYALRGYESDLGGSFGELGRGELPEWSVGATLSLPVFNRADRGTAAQAEADVATAEIDAATLEGTLAQQARAQVRTLEAASRYVALATLNVRLGEETLAAERARLVEGRALQKDVIAAIKELDAARVESERARAAWQDALVALRRLEGRL
ncbi:MAG: TolC family protein [Pseudomonadota bacterium]|nr:TolC family protein [Pseudomonadota bacterium]